LAVGVAVILCEHIDGGVRGEPFTSGDPDPTGDFIGNDIVPSIGVPQNAL